MRQTRRQDDRAPAADLGPFRNEAEALAAIVERLVRDLSPDAVYLFGSRALGTARPDSDYDLVIVLKDDWNTEPLDYDAAYRPLLGLGVGCDLIPYPRSLFAAERNIEGTIAFAAANRGCLLYRYENGHEARESRQ